MDNLSIDAVSAAVSGSAAAFRCRRKLQPAGGPGDKVFPPTFAGAVYAIEERRLPGREEPVRCVVLDTVQSQANRMELALQEAVDSGEIKLPLVISDFSDFDPTGDIEADESSGRLIEKVGQITSLEAPHRIADAIFRDSVLDGIKFRKSERGKALNTIGLSNATPLFELCPTALIFGMWDSTGPKGGLGAKFERAIVSEIVGIGAQWEENYKSRGVRRDPLEISKNVSVLQDDDKSLLKVADDATNPGAIRPSELNHSSVPFEIPNSGVTIEYAEQTTTLSLICLRHLRFPVDKRLDPAIDNAARTVLTALGLLAATLAFEAGTDLRSRCLLWPDGPMTWELLDYPGEPPKTYRLSKEDALSLFRSAVDRARSVGLPWPEEPLVLKPSDELVKLVRLSQLEIAKKGEATE